MTILSTSLPFQAWQWSPDDLPAQDNDLSQVNKLPSCFVVEGTRSRRTMHQFLRSTSGLAGCNIHYSGRHREVSTALRLSHGKVGYGCWSVGSSVRIVLPPPPPYQRNQLIALVIAAATKLDARSARAPDDSTRSLCRSSMCSPCRRGRSRR
jgi:hypothetical protein